MRMRHAWPLISLPLLACGVLAVAFLATLSGCPAPDDGNGNAINGNTEPAPVTLGIVNIQSNLTTSLSIAMTVLYNVPASATEVIAFYRVLDAPADAGGQPIGIEETIAEGLPAGENGSFEFDTTGLPPGFYQLGVQADNETYLSKGTIELKAAPDPVFLEPTEDLTIRAGVAIQVVIDLGDPESNPNWRLFYQDADAPLLPEGLSPTGQLLGIRLAEGRSSSVDFTWDTLNIKPGLYRFGISATDVGATIGEVVAAGGTAAAEAIVTSYSEAIVEIQSAPTEAKPPVLVLTTEDQTAFIEEEIEITFEARTFEGNDFVVTLFYVLQDDDGEDAGDQVVFATITDPTVESASFDTGPLRDRGNDLRRIESSTGGAQIGTGAHRPDRPGRGGTGRDRAGREPRRGSRRARPAGRSR